VKEQKKKKVEEKKKRKKKDVKRKDLYAFKHAQHKK